MSKKRYRDGHYVHTAESNTPSWGGVLGLVTLVCVGVIMVACGGGGEGGANVAQEAPALPPGQPISDRQDFAQSALARLNDLRETAGMGRLTSDAGLESAARAHSRYSASNLDPGHNEIRGADFFSGVTLADRLAFAGYPFALATEVQSYRSELPSGAAAIDDLMGAIYHRYGMLRQDMTEVGAGAARNAGTLPYMVLTVDMGSRSNRAARVGEMAVWPPAGWDQTPIKVRPAVESPNPLPGVVTAGYPVSIHIPPFQKLIVSSFDLRRGDGMAVPTKLLSNATGDQASPVYGAAIFPLEPLQADTEYVASVSASVDGYYMERTWRFRTKN